MTHDGRRHALLAIDTATTRVVVATGSPDGVVDGLSTWVAGYRHGETLLANLSRVLGEGNIRRSRLTGIVVGTGPGAFTGLRVGLATAKGLAHGLRVPIAGISTAEALLAAAAAAERAAAAAAAVEPAGAAAKRAAATPTPRLVLLGPAGTSDRILTRAGETPRLLPAGTEPDLAPDERLVAIDLDGRAPADASARGEVAFAGLGAALVALGAARLRAGGDDLAGLVPEYVTLPRGVTASDGTVSWSRDPR